MKTIKKIKQIKQGKFELYLHEKQKKSYISGQDLLAYLKENNLFEDCATLEDLKSIQKEGIEFFRKYYESDGEVVLGW